MSLRLKELAFVLSVVSLPAAASEVRVSSMGRSAGLDDEAYVFAFPSNVTRYSLAIAEIGNASYGEAYGAVMTQVGSQSLGVAVSRDQSLFTYRNATTLSTDVPDYLSSFTSKYRLFGKYLSTVGYAPERPVDILWGMGLGENSGFGMRLTLATNNHETTTESIIKKSANQVDVHFGYHMPVGGARMEMALKIGALGRLQTSAQTQGGAKTTLNVDRGIETRFLARYLTTDTAATTRPYAKMGVSFVQPKVEQSTLGVKQSRKAKELSFDIAGGVNYAPNEKVTLTSGLGGFFFNQEGPYSLSTPVAGGIEQAIQQGNETVTLNLGGANSTRSGYGLVANLGGEALMSERWGMMLGLDYILWGRLRTRDNFSPSRPVYISNLTATSDSELWTFGAYYQIEKELRIDASVALKDFVHRGPNFLTGGTTVPFIPQFAAVYKF